MGRDSEMQWRRRGFVGALLGAAAGLAWLGSGGRATAAPRAQPAEDVDALMEELNNQITQAIRSLRDTSALKPIIGNFGEVEGRETQINQQMPTDSAVAKMWIEHLEEWARAGQAPLLEEYLTWLGPRFYYGAGVAPGSLIVYRNTWSWLPVNLRQEELQRSFAGWLLNRQNR